MIKQTRAFRNNYPAAILLTILLLFSAASQAQLRDGLYHTPITPPYSWKSGWFKVNLSIPDSIAPFGIGRGSMYFDTITKSAVINDGLTWIYQRGVDSIWIVDGGADPDTLRYRSLGTTYTAGTITGGGGSSYTFTNGLTESAGTVKLGGALTEGTHIWNNIFKYSYALSGTDSVVAQTNNTGFRVDRYKTGVANNLIVGEDMYFEVNNGSTQSAGLQFFNSFGSMATYFQDSRTVKTGLQYSSLDTTGWATSTLVTKDYINKRLSNRLTYNLINGATNLGIGSQVFKDTSSNKINLRSLTAGWGLDIAQNTNEIDYKADTAQLATSTAVRDTAQALRYIISGESVAWGTYAQRVALTGMVAGQRFYQTNERVGLWVYDGSEWIHSPPVSSMKNSSMQFSGSAGHGTSGTGATAGYVATGNTFINSGGYVAVSTGTTSTGFALSYATQTNVARTTMPADSANNGYKMVLVGKVALSAAPSAGEDFRFNFGTRNQGSTFINDSTAYGYAFSIANYRNSSFIECYTGQRGGQPVITTTTSVPIANAVFAPVSGYPTDISQAIEGFITFVLVYNTKYVDYYINGTLVASHTLTSSRANNTGFNDWVLSIAKTTGTTSRTAVLESVYSYYIKDNF